MRYEDKWSITIANIVKLTWLSKYPWHTLFTYDRGSELIGHEFRNVIRNDYGIKCKPITVRNPQANAIVERVHQVIGNMLRTFELENNYLDETDPWSGIWSATAFAVCSAYHTMLQATPGQLVFGCDMVFNIGGAEKALASNIHVFTIYFVIFPSIIVKWNQLFLLHGLIAAAHVQLEN